ncbi:MAG: glucosaminidase domain-containing protein [Trichloromonas sp.]|jgi:Bax protein|nr:glucosaminidase domain-containing protein [Trichloromonas sp.]
MRKMMKKLSLALLFIPLISGSALAPPPSAHPLPTLSGRPSSHVELEALFSRHNYEWGTLDEGIPSIFLEGLPDDLHRISQADRKKAVFFLSLLPVVLRVNEEIRAQKDTVETLLERHDQGQTLSAVDRARLTAIAGEYKVAADPLSDERARRTLLSRVDTLPASLVLAQAATESAYGTSRFARLGNNLFGEWTFIPGTGIVPRKRQPGRTHEVRSFASIYESVSSYMKNINTHRAYQTLRELRAEMRASGQPLRGEYLAEGLARYSEQGQAYVRKIKSVIRSNRLQRLTSVIFRPETEPAEAAIITAGLFSSAQGSSRWSGSRLDP